MLQTILTSDAGKCRLAADEMEPAIAAMLDRKAARISLPPYKPQTVEQVAVRLEQFIREVSPGSSIVDLNRMGGGASKEQFVFDLAHADGFSEKLVLRMDPMQTASESDRQREFEMLEAVGAVVPVPRPRWIDPEGVFLGRPSAIMDFVGGVTKPTQGSGGAFSGVGIYFPPKMRGPLGGDLIEKLASIHRFDWRTASLPNFSDPSEDPYLPALWQVNWWSRVWRDDTLHSNPIAAAAEHWMRANLPKADKVVVVHGDFRPGNFLFDEDRLEITAVLDWELVHLGDFHEDLAWILLEAYATCDEDVTVSAGLFDKEYFLSAYEQASGNSINRTTLQFYEIFCIYKCMAIVLATSSRAVDAKHNHQDVLLSWLVGIGYIFEHALARRLQELFPESSSA
jgi:aminoglycoside phosphotransferase (APT) family kinase protein